MLGAWLGAGVVAKWPKYKVQIGMGLALIAAALLMVAKQYGWPSPPPGTPAIGVRGVALLIAVAGNFMLGALMTLGIGLYAPCMILVSFLGMSETTAFPIMMGSCAFLMPVGSLRFIRERCYSLRAALGLAIGGIPGVLLAAYIVKSLPLVTVRWLVIVVVIYTAITMLYSAFTRERSRFQCRARSRGVIPIAQIVLLGLFLLASPEWTPQTSGVNVTAARRQRSQRPRGLGERRERHDSADGRRRTDVAAAERSRYERARFS